MAVAKDINDAFDDILLSEERIIENAYHEGLEKGKAEGNPEGYHLGYHRGAEVGAELGYYLGVIQSYLIEENIKQHKVYSHLTKLQELIETFPKTNDSDYDILGKIDEIRALYKKACSQLKISGTYPESDKMSF